MQINLSYVSEKDIDLLIIEELISSEEFRNLFLYRTNRHNYSIHSIEHSKFDPIHGESDITVLFTIGTDKYALLIENKVDALAMPSQCERYFNRGDFSIKMGEYNSYDVFIVAPKSYLATNEEAKKYPYQLTYEEIIDYYTKYNSARFQYKIEILSMAIQKKINGYTPQLDLKTTDFNRRYEIYQEKYFPNIEMYKYPGDRGPRAVWPGFKSYIKGGHITHKSNKGYVDLMFNGLGNHLDHISTIFDKHLDEDMLIVKTGKSGTIRIHVPIIDFKDDFDKQEDRLVHVFNAVYRLTKLTHIVDDKVLFSPIK